MRSYVCVALYMSSSLVFGACEKEIDGLSSVESFKVAMRCLQRRDQELAAMVQAGHRSGSNQATLTLNLNERSAVILSVNAAGNTTSSGARSQLNAAVRVDGSHCANEVNWTPGGNIIEHKASASCTVVLEPGTYQIVGEAAGENVGSLATQLNYVVVRLPYN